MNEIEKYKTDTSECEETETAERAAEAPQRKGKSSIQRLKSTTLDCKSS